MNKKKIWVPTYQASSIYDIPMSFFLEKGITTVLSDLDNTLDAYNVKDPSPRAFELVARFKEAGIAFFVASNNTSKRVKRYAQNLGIKAFCGLKKPFSGPLKKTIASEGFDKTKTVLIGDQVLTDVIAGNGAGILTILTNPVSKLDAPWTRVNRILEKGKRKRLNKEPYNSKERVIV